MKAKQKYTSFLFILLLTLTQPACKKFVEVPDPIDQIPSDIVFDSESKAASAVRGLYGAMVGSTGGFFALYNGYAAGVSVALGVSADEITANSGTTFSEFFENNVNSSSGTNGNNLWGALYNLIFNANAVVENLAKSTGISESGKKQYGAEARFIRAANYFYLVNMYGNIPMPVTTNYQVNANLPNVPAADVYQLIISDLKYAQENLGTAYPGPQRLRANKYTASALLARVYLYREDWANAAATASLVIDGAGKSIYDIEPDLNKAFLTSSKEVILQLQQPGTNLYTWDGYVFISGGIPQYQITDALYNSFEAKDLRKTNWIKTNNVTNGGVTKGYNFPFKYKLNSGTGTVRTESMVFLRLSETYLIRAEARAKLGQLADAIKDLDVVRKRAGIDLIQDINPGINQSDLLDIIAHERFVELFTENGQRWLDLKRTGKADIVLRNKPNWRPEAKLFPIPLSDINFNPFLKQNPGYN